MRARALAPALLAAALLLPAGTADHVRTENGRSLAFDHRAGNEWWVEVAVGGPSAGQVVGVDARDTGGAWKALTLRSWGAWAASFHVEPGHLVQFRARFADGASMLSCEFTHPAGQERCGSPPPPGNFSASFTNVKGNEWWIQASVAATGGTLARVDARLDGGDWKPLADKGWGWAASHHAPSGTVVQLRAISTTGAESLSGCYRWTAATPVACGDSPPPGAFNATFSPKPGNEWWVEVGVKANEPLAGVDARVAGGAWHALTLRSWGAWAGSFHVPDGAHVEFRARSMDGDVALSGRYVWPSASPVTGPAWPVEGSYLRYLLDSGVGVPGYSESNLLWLNLTYRGGAWAGTCEGWRLQDRDDGNQTRQRLASNATLAVPRGPTPVEPGQGVVVALPACGGDSPSSTPDAFAFVDGRDVGTGYHGDTPYLQHGKPVEIPVWHASYEEDGCPCEWRALAWHPDTGLTIDFILGYRHSHESGHLVDTDAPISRNETHAPPTPAWPREGSFAEYQVNLTSEYSDVVEQADVRFTYVDGAWQMTCSAQAEAIENGPPLAPTRATPGSLVRPTEAFRCGITPPAVVTQGRFPQDTTRNGAFHRATVWWGDESGDTWGDEDAWWDVATGLLLKWEDHGGYFQGDAGWLTDTDAPLSRG